MNRSIVFLLLIALVLAAPGCRRHETAAGGDQTATIGRPEPQPGELGTDALTQTVELDDGRSEDEGGALTNPRIAATPEQPAPATQTTQTTKTKTTTRR